MDDERRLGLSQLCILLDGMRETHDYMSLMDRINLQKKLRNIRIFKEFNNDNIPINLKELNLLGNVRSDQMLVEMLNENEMAEEQVEEIAEEEDEEVEEIAEEEDEEVEEEEGMSDLSEGEHVDSDDNLDLTASWLNN